jgi:hypothetical protein
MSGVVWVLLLLRACRTLPGSAGLTCCQTLRGREGSRSQAAAAGVTEIGGQQATAAAAAVVIVVVAAQHDS